MAKAIHWMTISSNTPLSECRSLSARRLNHYAQTPGPMTPSTHVWERRAPMSAPRDSRCRYKECYNCKHRLNSVTEGKPEYNCGLASDGTIRVIECGGLRHYLPATKAQRREQHGRLMEY